MLLLSSCATTITTSVNTQTPEETATSTSEPTVDFKSILYTVYSDPQYIDLEGKKPVNEDGKVLDHNGNEISYAEFSSSMFAVKTLSSEKDANADSYKTIKLNDKEYRLNYDKTEKSDYAECADKRYHKFGYIEHYTFSGKNVEISAKFNKATGELVSWTYTPLNVGNISTDGDFSVEEAKEKAKEYICSLYGVDVFDSYTYNYGTIAQRTIGEWRINTVIISYQHDVNGCTTGDNIVIVYDLNGQMLSFKALEKGVYDFLDNEIGLQKVENAEKAVTLAIPENYIFENFKSLKFNCESETYFLDFSVYPESASSDWIAELLASVYINID